MADCTPQAVRDFFASNPGATQADAARYFVVSDRTIRNKLKQSVDCVTSSSVRSRRVSRFSHGVPLAAHVCKNKQRLVESDRPVFALVRGMVARDGSMWRCPHCSELMPVLAGTRSEVWNKTGCYNCFTRSLAPLPASAPPADDALAAKLPATESGNEAMQSDISAVSVPVVSAVSGSKADGDLHPSVAGASGHHVVYVVKRYPVVEQRGLLQTIWSLAPVQVWIALAAWFLLWLAL